MACEYCKKTICEDPFKCSISFLLAPPALVPVSELSTQPPRRCVQRTDVMPMVQVGNVGRAEVGEMASQVILWQLKNADPYCMRNGTGAAHWAAVNTEQADAANANMYIHPGGLAWGVHANRSPVFHRLSPGTIFLNFTVSVKASYRSNWVEVQCNNVLRTRPIYLHKCRGKRPIRGQGATIGTCHHSACCRVSTIYRAPVTGGPKVRCTTLIITRRFIDADFANELQASSVVSISDSTEVLERRRVGTGKVFKICAGCIRPVSVDRLARHLGRHYSYHTEE